MGGLSGAERAALRPYVLLGLAWFLATNHVLSRHAGPDSMGPPAPGETAPAFRPGLLLMQPVYTAFYTLVLTSLFSMAWMEHRVRSGAQDDAGGFECMRDDGAFHDFLALGAAVCASGLLLAVPWGVYMKRASPPEDHAAMRQGVFYFCCAQLALGAVVTASYASGQAGRAASPLLSR